MIVDFFPFVVESIKEVGELFFGQSIRVLLSHKFLFRFIYFFFSFQLKCCGLHSATEWIPNTPPSCCETNAIECVALVNAYGQGCSQSLRELIAGGSTIFGSTAIAVAAIEVIKHYSMLNARLCEISKKKGEKYRCHYDFY